ncbi:hypothetical protein lerEdw1_003261 [Lerista edwardsae]|nr:hypothetical protein lerEdw1_003261 [Lerista edwardsae]
MKQTITFPVSLTNIQLSLNNNFWRSRSKLKQREETEEDSEKRLSKISQESLNKFSSSNSSSILLEKEKNSLNKVEGQEEEDEKNEEVSLTSSDRHGFALQIQCYQCEEFQLNNDCSSPEFIVNCTVNVQDMCQKEVMEQSSAIQIPQWWFLRESRHGEPDFQSE